MELVSVEAEAVDGRLQLCLFFISLVLRVDVWLHHRTLSNRVKEKSVWGVILSRSASEDLVTEEAGKHDQMAKISKLTKFTKPGKEAQGRVRGNF